jgi:hypothetical protein
MAMGAGVPVKDLNEENSIGWKRLASATRCSRCGGLMVIEQGFDFLDHGGHPDFRAWRCVQCGEFIDPVILLNRQRSLPIGAS